MFPHFLAGFVLLAGSASAQTTYLFENHNTTVPGPGWTQDKINPAAQGWIQSVDLRAWHEDEFTSVGATDDRLISPSMNLSAAGAVYVHFYSQLNYAQWLANHPSTIGDGENDLWISTDNGVTWVEVWTDTRIVNSTDWSTVDISSYAGNANVKIALRFYGTFAQEWWVDDVIVDDVPTNPLPPPAVWTVNLPAGNVPVSSFSACDDFESYAGVVPNFMALTAVNGLTGLPDVEAWCTIAGGTTAASSGIRNLEMGLLPGSTNYHDVRNALVIGLDGTGAGLLTVDFMGINFGEEDTAADGVWVSSNGSDWYRALVSWTVIPVNAIWNAVSVDLTGYHAITNGPFYLMFQQQDNFPYNDLDGIGVDDLCISASGPLGPTLTKNGSCPGLIGLQITNATANAPVALFYGPAGSFTQSSPSRPCQGIVLGIQTPHFVGFLTTNASGQTQLQFNAPSGACGVAVQAADMTTCAASNSVTL
ncbi:MAG: hypothetical protein O3A20_03650 [Planctomycetota bacterium]|nr:hypothetical protein [Planctomycetota bacterium]